jgi:acyl carrier protein
MTSQVEKTRSLIAEALNVSIDRIQPDLAVGDIPEWDSLANTRLMIALEQEFNLNLDVEDVLDLETVEDIIDIVAERQPG